MINHVISIVFLVIFESVSVLVFNEKPTYIDSVIIYFVLLIHSITLDIRKKQEEQQ